MMPVARLYVAAGRFVNGLGSSAFACRLEKALQAAAAHGIAMEIVLLVFGALALSFLLASAAFMLIYCQLGFFSLGPG